MSSGFLDSPNEIPLTKVKEDTLKRMYAITLETFYLELSPFIRRSENMVEFFIDLEILVGKGPTERFGRLFTNVCIDFETLSYNMKYEIEEAKKKNYITKDEGGKKNLLQPGRTYRKTKIWEREYNAIRWEIRQKKTLFDGSKILEFRYEINIKTSNGNDRILSKAERIWSDGETTFWITKENKRVISKMG